MEVEKAKYWKRTTIVGAFGRITDIADSVMFSYVIAILAPLWAIDPFQAGYISAARSLGGVIGFIFMSPIIDHIGRKKGLVWGNLLTGLTWLVLCFATNWLGLFLVRVIVSVLAGISTGSTLPLIAEHAPTKTRGSIYGYALAIATLCSSLLTSAVTLTEETFGLSWVFLPASMVAVNIIAALLGQFFIAESPVWEARSEAIEKGEIKEQKASIGKLKDPKILKLLVISLLMYSIPVGTMEVSVGLGSYFARTVLKIPVATLATIGLISPWISAAGNVVIGKVSDRIGRIKAGLIFAIILAIALMLQFRTAYFVVPGAISAVIAWTLINWIYGFASTSTINNQGLWVNETFPTGIRATALGLITGLGYAIRATADTLTGPLAAAYGIVEGYTAPCYIAIAAIFIGLFVSHMLRLETRGKKLEL